MRSHESLLAWQEANAVVSAVVPAARECGQETAELLELCGDLALLPRELTQPTLERCRQCQRLLRGLINRLRKA
jgi:hypothetical protein